MSFFDEDILYGIFGMDLLGEVVIKGQNEGHQKAGEILS
jgi:hypothetical protein